MATLLHDIIEDITDALKIPVLPLTGQSEDELNEQLDEAAAYNSVLMYTQQQTGTIEVTRQKYGYIEYNTVLWFGGIVADETTQSVTAVHDKQVQNAFEFLCKLTQQTAWRTHPANAEPLRPTFSTFVDWGDVTLAGVQVNLLIRLDPSFDRDNVCD